MLKLLEVSRTITQTVAPDAAIVVTSSTKVLLPWPTIIGLWLLWPGFNSVKQVAPTIHQVISDPTTDVI
jgi:hypothetical protein